MRYTVLIPGGFKPLHKGHYDYIKFYLDNDDVKEVRLYVGDKKREEITIEHTEALLELYGLMKHPKLVYRRAIERNGPNGPYTNPLADCYDWAENQPFEPVALGLSEKEQGYSVGFKKYFAGIRENIIEAPLFKMKDQISATDFRKALRNNESISHFIPNGVDEKEVLKLFNVI